MRGEEMAAMLKNWNQDLTPSRGHREAETFDFDRPPGFEDCSLERARYIDRLTELIHRSGSRRHLSIGALLGTMEAFLSRCYRPQLERIVIVDVDLESYNPNRDMGAYCYRNICGTKFGGFGGLFAYLRDDSKQERAKRAVRALGPFDTVFVDGEHSRTAVMSDMTLAAEVLDHRGTIFVHDLELPGDVAEGYRDWLAANAGWDHVEVPGCDFMLGLGIVQRAC